MKADTFLKFVFVEWTDLCNAVLPALCIPRRVLLLKDAVDLNLELIQTLL